MLTRHSQPAGSTFTIFLEWIHFSPSPQLPAAVRSPGRLHVLTSVPPRFFLQSFLHMESRVVLLKPKSPDVSSLIKITLGCPRPRLIPRLSYRVLRLLTSVTSLPSSPSSVISGHLAQHLCPLHACSFWNILLVRVIPCGPHTPLRNCFLP